MAWICLKHGSDQGEFNQLEQVQVSKKKIKKNEIKREKESHNSSVQ